MGKKLAIKGHSTRGKEVIELLEMMGGKNNDCSGKNIYAVYSIPDDGYIYPYQHAHNKYPDDFVIFTLEEFLEKYPFKVGDKVVYTKFGDNCDDYPVTIESMKWTGTTIEYAFNDCVTCLAKDLKIWNGEPDEVISGINLNSYDYADEVELNLGDYEIKVRDGRTYAVLKKPKYPKTYAECCERVNACPTVSISYDSDEDMLYNDKFDLTLLTLRKLIICRNAYWKIAGEEMGLGKPWEPDWTNYNEYKQCLYITENVITKGIFYNDNKILSFPTAEMRDAFYENFKDLIEQCKELL